MEFPNKAQTAQSYGCQQPEPLVKGVPTASIWHTTSQVCCTFLPASMLSPPLAGASKSAGETEGDGGRREQGWGQDLALLALPISYPPSWTLPCGMDLYGSGQL